MIESVKRTLETKGDPMLRTIAPDYLERMVEGYLDCAIRESSAPDPYTTDGRVTYSDAGYSTAEFENKTRVAAIADCMRFCIESGIDANPRWTATQAGHDLWLTRCGLVGGFSDRYMSGKGAAYGEQLARIARRMGEVTVFVESQDTLGIID